MSKNKKEYYIVERFDNNVNYFSKIVDDPQLLVLNKASILQDRRYYLRAKKNGEIIDNIEILGGNLDEAIVQLKSVNDNEVVDAVNNLRSNIVSNSVGADKASFWVGVIGLVLSPTAIISVILAIVGLYIGHTYEKYDKKTLFSSVGIVLNLIVIIVSTLVIIASMIVMYIFL